MNKKIIIVGIMIFIIKIAFFSFIFSMTREKGAEKNNLDPLIKADLEGVLSQQGEAVKNELIKSLNGKDGTLLSNASMEIGYLFSAPPLGDRIMVFINGTGVDKIEKDALSWLRSRGFSNADLCNLPVVFSIANPNAETAYEYKLISNYIPDFCSE